MAAFWTPEVIDSLVENLFLLTLADIPNTKDKKWNMAVVRNWFCPYYMLPRSFKILIVNKSVFNL